MPVKAQKIYPRELIFQKHPQLLSVIQVLDPWESYEKLKEIGSGTYGNVYKVKHQSTGTYAALKCVKIDLADDLKGILTELYVLKDCHHPNIVEFYGAFLTENAELRQTQLWLAMEYCGGRSLQDIYATTRRPFEEATIAFVMRDTVRGLSYLHSQQHIHRDIKGANILLTRDGKVKLADLGISAQISETLGKRKSVIGTPYWMAPEVADVSRKGGYDERCDIWAVGITSIELAELEPPLFNLHPMKALQLMTTSRFKPAKLRDRNMWSGEFHDFLKTTLRLNPKSRPSAEELLAHQFLAAAELSERLTADLLQLCQQEYRRHAAAGYDELRPVEQQPQQQQQQQQKQQQRQQRQLPLLTFELLLRRGCRLPLLCVGVERNGDTSVRFRLLDLNKLHGCLELSPPRPPGVAVAVAEAPELEVTCVQQLDLGAVLLCHEDSARVFHLDTGRLMPVSAGQQPLLTFHFTIESAQCQHQQLLCFYKHGFQAKAFAGGRLLRDFTDEQHVYRFLGMADAVPVVERRPAADPMANCDILLVV